MTPIRALVRIQTLQIPQPFYTMTHASDFLSSPESHQTTARRCASRLLPVAASLLGAGWAAAAVPDPLVAKDGKPIATPIDWQDQRRAEILEDFRTSIYGRNPVERPPGLEFEIGAAEPIFDGRGSRLPVTIRYGEEPRRGEFSLDLYLPERPAEAKGVFVLINNRAPEITRKAELSVAGSTEQEFFPVEEILGRGYIAAGFTNGEIGPDDKTEAFKAGVFEVFGPSGTLEDGTYPDRPDDAWATIAAWAWGASRAVDFLKSDTRFKELPVAVVGHSRGGKTALWCGAQDTRVDLTISNSSGSTGAAMARGKIGESVAMINTNFPHWFCDNYKKFNGREDELPVDQHMVIALCAPRLVYVQSSADDAHADPDSEYRSCVAATPVFELFGQKGVPAGERPAVNQPVQEGSIGYHTRDGEHAMKTYDWERYMDFADRHFKEQKSAE